MLPSFVAVNVTRPGATLRSDSSTFHSDSLALTATAATGSPAARGVGLATTANASNATTFRIVTSGWYDIRDLPPARVGLQLGPLTETTCPAGLFRREYSGPPRSLFPKAHWT